MKRSCLIVAVGCLGFVLWPPALVLAGSTNLASGEFFIKGDVSGVYADTHQRDDGYQSITEERHGNLSFLEHRWLINIAGGDSVSFEVEAHKTDAGDHEDFIFSYSTDGAVFHDMITVTNTVDNDTLQTFSLPTDLRGVVFIRVLDSDQTTKNLKKQESIHVDYMAVVCTGEPPPPEDNLLLNPGFEDGAAYWYGYDGVSLTTCDSPVHGGTGALYVANRQYDWQGPIHDLYNTMAHDHSYSNSIWIKLANTNEAHCVLTVKATIDGVDTYHHLDDRIITNQEWTLLEGVYSNVYSGTLDGLNMYVEGPPAGVCFYVDDAAVKGSGDWEQEANRRIDAVRRRDVQLRIFDCFGNPLSNVTVSVHQDRHHFAFGAALSEYVLHEPQYASYFTNHFEWAVFENETKWSEIESLQDAVSYDTADAMYGFCVTNGVRMRGHCIFWSVEQYIQEWVQDLAVAPDTLRNYMSNHLERTVSRYSEHFEHWDVNNEMLHGNFYSNIFGAAVRPWMFERARAVDADAKLFVNDYGVVSYSDTDKYIEQVQGLMDAGADIGGVGAQCHIWELNPYLLLNRLDTLGSLGLPVWCTEFDIANSDENERARQLEVFYRIAFSHDDVDGVLMWGFWASNHWRGADAALVNGDWTTNAAGRKYEELLEEWTTVTQFQSGVDGQVDFRGFHGSYTVTIQTNGGTSVAIGMDLLPGSGPLEQVLILGGADEDEDGMPDVWEEANQMNPTIDDAGSDADGDGLSNLDEYYAATQPTNAESRVQLNCTSDGSDAVLSFLGQPHRFYSIEYRTNLQHGAWMPVLQQQWGAGSLMSITNRPACPSVYYRLGVECPAAIE